MKTTTALRTLTSIDIKSIRRDSMLAWLTLIPFVPALLLRWGIPQVAPWLAAEFNLALEPYYPLITSVFTLLAPSLAGVIIGFLLLDERDDRTLTALLVTPLSLNNYLAYRVSAPILLGALLTLVIVPVVGLTAVPFLQLLPIALLAALQAPILALFLAAFAENKVVGFALMKAQGGIQMLPLAAYFIDSNWQLVAGIVPTYWPVKAFWLAADSSSEFWLYVVAGLAVNLAVLALFLRRFKTVLHR